MITYILVFWSITLCSCVGGYWVTVISNECTTTICSVEGKIQTLCLSVTLVTTHQTTWCHNPQHHSVHFHCQENLRSQYVSGKKRSLLNLKYYTVIYLEILKKS
jgi:hypothetical protein